METQHIIDNLDGFYGVLDTDGRHTMLNQVAASWLGFGSPERGLGLGYANINAPTVESIDFFLEQDDMVQQTGKKIFFLGYFGYYDRYRLIQGCKWPMPDENNKLIGIGCQFQDVTRFGLINKDRLIFPPNHVKVTKDNTVQFCYLFTEDESEPLLTMRERECLFFILQRKTIKEVGKILSLSPRTIEGYVDNIRMKLNCQSTSELLEKAILDNLTHMLPMKYLIQLWRKYG